MGRSSMSELPSEDEVHDHLTAIMREFCERWPGNNYGYVVDRWANESQGTNWAVAVTGSAVGSPGDLASYDEAIQAVHDRHPLLR